ncbi:MAG TPA: T9SS type A sorting domain-containing protein [Ignavibacteriaceae bacterium]|nr:T9SS type A sorting domain-containing protein [Ignavibacteriaceae bacterium]
MSLHKEIEITIRLFKKLFLVTLVSFFITVLFNQAELKGQWTNNLSQNTMLIRDTRNPINIISAENPEGGIFIVWEDSKNKTPDVLFQHIDLSGKVSLRADGKKISSTNGKKEKPVLSNPVDNAVIVAYKDFSSASNGELFLQKVYNSGHLAWGDNGLKLSNSDHNILNYSLSTDGQGNTFVSFIEKSAHAPSFYKIVIQKVSPFGYMDFPEEGIIIDSSVNAKNISTLIADGIGGVYIFWTESRGNKNIILANHIDKMGQISWGEEPVEISGRSSVITFKSMKINHGLVYLCWQTHTNPKQLFHQMVDIEGQLLWEQNGRQVSKTKGHQSNPQPVLSSDSSIILSWTNEYAKDKNVYFQKFRLNGSPVWEENGNSFLKLKGDQFGQVSVRDSRGGIIAAWFYSKDLKTKPDIFALRLNKNGEPLWSNEGSPLAVNTNSEKSYLSVASDQNDGLIAVFKDKRKDVTGIFGQRIFSNSTYVSHIIDFTGNVVEDSIKISWKTLNETNIKGYRLERLSGYNIADTLWTEVVVLEANLFSNHNEYVYFDFPDDDGTNYYRVIQVDDRGGIQYSDILKVNYIRGGSDNIVVYQNVPNPFSDSTQIVFNLPFQRGVKLEFYNSRVEKISEAVLTDTKAGRNRYTFRTNGLPAGVYFYRFIAGDFVEVKKMVITNR